MKRIKGMKMRVTAMLLSGMLVVGSVPGIVLASESEVEVGQTSDMDAEDTVEISSEEVFTEEYSDSVDVQEEGAEGSYTVTLDANGGYFENEWDDSLNDYVEQAEIINKQIPVGTCVTTFPIFTEMSSDGQQVNTRLFAGWSLERDGELVTVGDEEYTPADNCVLFAVWQVNETIIESEDASLGDAESQEAESIDENIDLMDASQEYEDNETMDGQTVIPAQEVLYSDGNEQEDIENSAGASNAEEETQDTLFESSEKDEETVTENASMGVVASGACGDNLTWILDEEGTLIISGTGDMNDYNYQGGPWEKKSVKTIVIENGVTSIGTCAFENCKNLTEASLSKNLKSIGSWAFAYCPQLTIATIPETVETIGFEAFRECTKLDNIIFPEKIKRIEGSAFADCRSLIEITIPQTITDIETWEFIGCTNLTTVKIKEGVSTIQKGAFYGCSNLSSIIIPASVNDIWEQAFTGCPSTLVIYGAKGSYAEQYAKDNNIEFKTLEQPVEVRKCLVYFDPNGGFNYEADPNAPYADYVFSYEYECGKKYGTLLDSTPPYKNGYEFIGWFTKKEGGSQVTKNSIVEDVDELTLYAHWKEGIYTVTFRDGVTGVPKTIVYKGYSTYGKLPIPQWDNYIFLGWYTDRQDGIKVEENDEIFYEDHTLWGHWLGPETYDIDTDNDGISDGWELYGADINADGNIDVDFPVMGADPNIPDIYIEVDWMTGLKPDPEAMKKVVEVFISHGIHVHIDAGPDSTDYVTGQTWDSNGHGNRIEWDDVFELGISNINWECTASSNFTQNRWTTFRYCLFVNQYKVYGEKKSSSSGKSNNIPGQWFIVANVNGNYSSKRDVAGTFMHELGHTLGLMHGGDERLNNKPNYLSIMNYLFQLDETFPLNYSEYVLPRIDENNISEYDGIGHSSAIEGMHTKWYLKKYSEIEEAIKIIRGESIEEFDYVGGAIDFNCNGNYEQSIKMDLNGDGERTELAPSQNDWEHLSFKGGNIGAGASIPSEIDIPVCSNPEWLEEMTLEEYKQIESNTVDYKDVVNAGTIIDSGTCGDNLTWTLDDNGTLVVKGTGPMKDYEISYGGPWKSHREIIKRIVIENGVSSIGSHAFTNCKELLDLSIPGSVDTIGWRAFNNCTKLEQLSIANGVTSIGEEAFCFCESLKKLVIPDSVTSIGDYAFCGCKSLTSLNITKGITNIGEYTFAGCESLREIVIPSNVTAIDKYAFYNCESLTDLTISEGVKSIGDLAFYNCNSLPSVIIPDSVESIERTAYKRSSGPDNGFDQGLIVYGKKNSSAEKFASQNEYHFSILDAKPIDAAVITVPDRKYTGYALTPALSVKVNGASLTENVDYRIKYSNNVKIGEATVKIIGIRDYQGTAKAKFKITKGIQKIFVQTSASSISLWETATISVTGAEWTTSFKSSNTSIATVDNNGVVTPVYPGTVTITVTANGNSNYEETSKSVSIKVKAISISRATVENLYDKTWTGKPLTQDPKVKINGNLLNSSLDYSVSYKNNKNAGTATIIISGKRYFGGSVTRTFKINKAAQSITAKSTASSIAVGKTATISITGNKGTKSYKSSNTAIATVTSAGKVTAKKVGTVKITATSAATSNYNAASKAVTIKVVPAATASITAVNQAAGIKLTWKKVTGATGYKVYRGSTLIKTIKSGNTVTYTDTKANTNGTKYTFKIVPTASTGNGTAKSLAVYRVARPAIKTAKNSAEKKMTVIWGRNAKATGYQIQYSPSKTFASGNKTATVTSAATVSKVIGSLTKGKTYYVRIRTYKTVGKTKYYSAWSAAKAVKITK